MFDSKEKKQFFNPSLLGRHNSSIVFLAVVCVIAICVFYTPMYWDDYMHGPLVDSNLKYTGEVLTTLNDCFKQSLNYYLHGPEGRFLINGLIPTVMIYIMPSLVMNIFHILVWMSLSYAIAINVLNPEQRGDKKKLFSIMSMTSLVLFTICGGKATTIFWNMGQFNYIWAGLIYLFYFYAIESGKLNSSLLVFISFLVGATAEVYAIPIGIMLAVLFLMKPSWRLFFTGLALALGTSTIIFAPSTLSRVDKDFAKYGFIETFLRSVVRTGVHAHIFNLTLLGLGVWFVRNKKTCTAFISNNKVLIILMSAFFFLNCIVGLAICSGPRIFFPMQLFSTVLLMRMYYASHLSIQFHKRLYGLLLVLFIGVSAYWIPHSISRYKQITIENEIIRNTTDGVAIADENYLGLDPTSVYNEQLRITLGQKHQISCLSSYLYHNLYENDTFCDDAQLVGENIFYKSASNNYLAYKLSDSGQAPIGFKLQVAVPKENILSGLLDFVWGNSKLYTFDVATITSKKGNKYVVAKSWAIKDQQVVVSATPVFDVNE